MRRVICFSLLFILVVSGTAMAQDRAVPMLRKGVMELGIEAGTIDLEGAFGNVDVDLAARFGYFLDRNFEIGPFVRYSRFFDGDYNSYGFGVFAEYHLFSASWVGFAETVPYVGADLGLGLVNTDRAAFENQNALVFAPRIGLKWYFRDYVAIDTNFFLALATDKIYVNDNDQDRYDYGFKIGLRVYFE